MHQKTHVAYLKKNFVYYITKFWLISYQLSNQEIKIWRLTISLTLLYLSQLFFWEINKQAKCFASSTDLSYQIASSLNFKQDKKRLLFFTEVFCHQLANNQNRFLLTLFLDFSKAFHTVDHEDLQKNASLLLYLFYLHGEF